MRWPPASPTILDIATISRAFIRNWNTFQLSSAAWLNSGTPPTAQLGRVLVTGGSGFVGANLVTTLLDQGYQVRSFDRAPSPLPAQPGLEVLQGDICDRDIVAGAVAGIDTVFHTAALIELMGGASVTEEYRRRSFAVNVEGTKNLVHAAQAAGVKRFVYTASNSVVMGGKRDRRRRRDVALHRSVQRPLHRDQSGRRERFVLSQNGIDGLLTCSIRPERNLGPRRSDDVPQGVRERAGRPRQGAGRPQERPAG